MAGSGELRALAINCDCIAGGILLHASTIRELA
jgi:hypothetical protein